MKKGLIIGLIVVVAVIVMIILLFPAKKYPSEFSVKYYATYSSSSGDRVLNITYEVVNKQIVSCQGTYVTDMTDGGNLKECEVDKLNNWDYNVPQFLIKEISSDTILKGNFTDEPSHYSWEVIFE